MGPAKAWIAWEVECVPHRAWRWSWKWDRVSPLTFLSLSLFFFRVSLVNSPHMYNHWSPLRTHTHTPHSLSCSHTHIVNLASHTIACLTHSLSNTRRLQSTESHTISQLYSTQQSTLSDMQAHPLLNHLSYLPLCYTHLLNAYTTHAALLCACVFLLSRLGLVKWWEQRRSVGSVSSNEPCWLPSHSAF